MSRYWNQRSCALLAGVALLAATGPASAGGFAVREQSTEFQGMSFAGDGAGGGGLSGMFWNPAVAADAPRGYSSESDYTGIFGHVYETATAGSTATITTPAGTTTFNPLALGADSGNMAKPALVPASYMAYRLDRNTVLALSINSPFGLTTDPSNNTWAGQMQARFSSIKTYDFAPTIAYRISPQLSVGLGLQIDYIDATLRDALMPTSTSLDTQVKGHDTAFGFTAGVNWTPTPTTSIGLGYRSALSHSLKGSASEPGFPTAFAADTADVEAALKLPDIVTLSARQAVNNKLNLLGTVEWTHWSNLQSLTVNCTAISAVLCTSAGNTVTSIPLGWHDSWMFALGGEYAYSRQLKLRSGAAYELSPIQNPSERTAKLPDQNRVWLSGGASYAINDMIGVDFAYSHIFGLGGGINRTETSSIGAVTASSTLIADVNSSVDIVSGSFKFKMNP